MRGFKRLRSAEVISAGRAFSQNLYRGHYELGVNVDLRHRISQAFTELARASELRAAASTLLIAQQRNSAG